MTRLLLAACSITAILALGLPANATGKLTCEPIPRDAWLTKSELTEKLVAAGWSIRFVKEDGGCWEAYGTTPEGQRVEAYFHPKSGKKLLVLRRGEVLFRAAPE